MADTTALHDAFIDELRDLYDAERQLIKALPRLARAATSEELKDAFESHLEETQTHVERLEQVFQNLDERVRGKHCEGMAGIVEEGKAILEEDFDEATMDACLVAAGQRAEHYEMAAYGTLIAWASVLGKTDAAELLQQTLDEEKAADEKLSQLAESGINQAAADADKNDEEGDDTDETGTASKRPNGRGRAAAASSGGGKRAASRPGSRRQNRSA